MALNSQGSRILHATNDSPSTYVAIEEVSSIGGPNGSAQLLDISHLASTGKEYLPGLPDFGQFSLACNLTFGAQQMALFQMFSTNAEAEDFRVEIPTDASRARFHRFGFSAIVSKWSANVAVNAKGNLTVDLQVTGSVRYEGIH